MEQSLSKDIRKLYTKSILWTIIMTVLTIIVAGILLVLLRGYMIPANHAENKALEAKEDMQEHTETYLHDKAFSKKQDKLKDDNVYLNEYSLDGQMMSGPEKFQSLFQDKSVPNVLNENITRNGYYHKIVPINDHGDIKGVWVYAYELKAGFVNNYYRYMMIGLVFLIFLSPIIYFIIFSRHYMNQLYQSIKRPIEELMTASHKISQKDLEFELNYNSHNELGQLTDSFRRMQKELKTSLYENWRKDSEWAVMMSSLSHDLKTPATLISLSTEVLNEEEGLTSEQQAQIDIINRNIQKVTNILQKMSEASHSNNPALLRDVVTAGELIQNIEKDIIPLMKEKYIQYHHDINVDQQLEVPYLELSRILENLFSNAIQYTPESGDIYFSIEGLEETIRIVVEDSGPGIKRENRELVFSKHFREDASRSDSLGNAGLGLFIAKNLVKKLGGSIRAADPEVLQGARIELLIPYT